MVVKAGANILSEASHIGDAPSLIDLIGTIKVMLDAYEQGELDRLFFVHNEFVNTMTQKPVVVQLLPLVPDEEESLTKHHWFPPTCLLRRVRNGSRVRLLL